MKYTCEIEIERPLDKVVALFEDPDNLMKWMPGLVGMEHLSGEPGKPGSKSRIRFDMNGRKMEMTETLVERDLPRIFHATYETTGVFNTLRYRFEGLENATRCISEDEFKFTNLPMKLMGFFLAGAFRKQTMKHLEAFKAFAEAEGSGNEGRNGS